MFLIKFRYNSVSINEVLLELLSIYLIVVVQSWKSTTLKKMNGIKDVRVYSRIRSNIKIIEIRILLFTGRVWGKGKLILFDVSLLKEKYVSIKNIG